MADITALVAERLSELRRAAALSQPRLARILGVSHATISYWETGKVPMDTDRLTQLSEVFGVEPEALFSTDKEALLRAIDDLNRRRVEGRLIFKEDTAAAQPAGRSPQFAGLRELVGARR